MEAKEIRVGNLVLDNNNKVVRIESILGNQYKVFVHLLDEETLTELRLDQIRPIDLNKEWLLRLGGTIDVDNSFKINGYVSLGELKIYNQYNEFAVLFQKVCISIIKYVHELQNIVFDLSREKSDIIKYF